MPRQKETKTGLVAFYDSGHETQQVYSYNLGAAQGTAVSEWVSEGSQLASDDTLEHCTELHCLHNTSLPINLNLILWEQKSTYWFSVDSSWIYCCCCCHCVEVN